MSGFRFNTPPNWPTHPEGWTPPDGWTPPEDWGPAPEGWDFWVPVETPTASPEVSRSQDAQERPLTRREIRRREAASARFFGEDKSSTLPAPAPAPMPTPAPSPPPIPVPSSPPVSVPSESRVSVPSETPAPAAPVRAQASPPPAAAASPPEVRKITVLNAKRVAEELQSENLQLRQMLAECGGMELLETRRRIDEEWTAHQARMAQAENDVHQKLQAQRARFESWKADKEQEARDLSTHVMSLQQRVNELNEQVVTLGASAELQMTGVYEFYHPAQDSMEYREKLERVRERYKAMSKGKEARAIHRSSTFMFNGSKKEGTKFVNDLATAMLQAYNNEAENCVKSIKSGNIQSALRRLESSKKKIATLGKLADIYINEDYHALRIKELELTSDYYMMLQEEKEREREIRERQKEERKLEREIAEAKAKVERERQHYLTGLKKVQERLAAAATEEEKQEAQAAIQEMEEGIAQAEDKMEDVLNREANIRAGTVYVISNVGSFGKGIVKVGMTRRLDPMERIKELSGTSVPFPFDIHLLQMSDDAVGLEAALHRHLQDRKVNWVRRREFFYATPEEIREILRAPEFRGHVVEYTTDVEATEFHQSLKYSEENGYGERAHHRLV